MYLWEKGDVPVEVEKVEVRFRQESWWDQALQKAGRTREATFTREGTSLSQTREEEEGKEKIKTQGKEGNGRAGVVLKSALLPGPLKPQPSFLVSTVLGFLLSTSEL